MDEASTSFTKTFWRARLYDVIRKPILLKGIEVGSGSPQFEVSTWEEHWSCTPPVFRDRVLRLRTAWRSYIESGFDPSLAEVYCKRYCDLLSAVIERRKGPHSVFMRFLATLLGSRTSSSAIRMHHQPLRVRPLVFATPFFCP